MNKLVTITSFAVSASPSRETIRSCTALFPGKTTAHAAKAARETKGGMTAGGIHLPRH
jgi:hypothetical protein